MPKITGLCRAVADAELKLSGAGNDYATMRIAFTERQKDSNKTVWATAKIFGARSKTFANLKKGEMFFVSGNLEMTTTEDKKTFLDVIVDDFEFVYASKGDGAEKGSPATSSSGQKSSKAPTPSQGVTVEEDDIPF